MTALSDFRKKKLTGFFSFNDLDRDGRLSGDDYKQVIRNYAEIHGAEVGGEKHVDLERRYQEQWEAMKAFDADGDGVIGLDEYLAGMEAWLADRDSWTNSMDTMITSFYEIVDHDGDGSITEDELVMDFRAHGQSEDAARKAFAKLDRNGDGLLARDEMVTGIIEAFYSEDPEAPGNWLALPDGP